MKTLKQDSSFLDISTREGNAVHIQADNLLIVIKHNDIGVSIDYYPVDKDDAQPFREDQVLFEDADDFS